MAITQENWSIDTSLATASAFRQFRKKHPREYDSCFNNLDKIIRLLDEGKTLSEIQYNPSFFRHETEGIFRIGQSGLAGAKESRLYIYLSFSGRMIYVLGIGTKETQQADLRQARKSIKNIGK